MLSNGLTSARRLLTILSSAPFQPLHVNANKSLAATPRIENEFEPVCEKTNNLGFRPGLTQTGLYSHRSRLEAWNFRCRKERDSTICVAKSTVHLLHS